MTALPADGGGGYAVDAQSLHSFGRTAGAVGENVGALSVKVQAALALGIPGGLDIGAAIGRARDAWAARFQQLAGEAAGISANLTSNAAAYDETESATHQTLIRVLRDGAYVQRPW